MIVRCNIKHGFGDQTCIRPKGHDGLCCSKSEPGATGTLTYSEWESKNGKFHRHVGYRTLYAKNAVKRGS